MQTIVNWSDEREFHLQEYDEPNLKILGVFGWMEEKMMEVKSENSAQRGQQVWDDSGKEPR